MTGPVTMCANCDLPVHQVQKRSIHIAARPPRSRTTATGWDHWGLWQGVRCPGRITGAQPGRQISEDEYRAWLAERTGGNSATVTASLSSAATRANVKVALGLSWDEIERLMAEDPDDRAIREAHGFSYEDDYEDRTLLCRKGCGETYFDVAVGKIRECRSTPDPPNLPALPPSVRNHVPRAQPKTRFRPARDNSRQVLQPVLRPCTPVRRPVPGHRRHLPCGTGDGGDQRRRGDPPVGRGHGPALRQRRSAAQAEHDPVGEHVQRPVGRRLG
jgi:hypothetical protein